DLAAQIAQARASLAAQQAQLDELKRGTRPEELQIAQTNVINAQKAFDDAKSNLTNVKSSADASLKQVYDGALSAAAKSVSVAANSIYVLTDIQFARFLGSDQISTSIADAKSKAIASLLGGVDTGLWSNNFISQLNGGTKAFVAETQGDPTYPNVDSALEQTAESLSLVKVALESIPVTSDLSSTERTNLSTEKSNVNTEIITISGKQQSIKVQLATNTYNITAAETTANSAQNTLATANDQLKLKLAGSTPEQIAAQEAQVNSAKANIDVLQAQQNKTVLRAPIDGIVTKQEAKIGQIVAANAVLISLLSDAKFEIEANVSENEIAKVNLSDKAEMTLDALGPAEKFSGRIIKIDPIETIVSGVIYYKVTSVFDAEDERIKPGMTVNLDIQTDKKTDVLTLPYYTVKGKNGEKYVQILVNGQISEKIIKTGLEGETMIEITEGLKEGEVVVMPK
ncbi:hypothetical protein A3J77_01460, partial [Candidatus Wolfebacteria bacterium RBG_13_41_7]